MKKQRGVTLIALAITIIVMLILAGISSYYGVDLIQKVKLQDLKTNMLLIQAKAKEAIEEVNFQKANIIDEATIEQIKSENLIGVKITESSASGARTEATNKNIIDESKIDEYYYLRPEDLEKIGLQDIKNAKEYGYFIIKYDIENLKVDVMNTNGYKGIYNLEQLPNDETDLKNI